MRVNNIFISYMGECNPFGFGTPAIFIRMSGCNLRCPACDSKETWLSESGIERDPKEVAAEIKQLRKENKIDLVCITGGEPLMQKDLIVLLEELKYIDKVIETNGSIDFTKFILDSAAFTHFVVDYKMPPSLRFYFDMTQYAIIKADEMSEEDIIKFVISNEAEFLIFKKELSGLSATKAKIYVGAGWGSEYTTSKIAELIIAHKLAGQVHLNFQLHKLSYTADYTVKTFPKNL